MDIAQLRNFVAVAEAGSYIRAADLLDVPQPTLSRQIRALEVELRASLFHRHGRGVLPTEAGKKFLEYARSVLHTVDQGIAAIRDTESMLTGRLGIGLTPSMGRLIVPTLMPRMVERFPRAQISVVEGLSGLLYERVLLGQLDFALVLNPLHSSSLRVVPLVADPLCLIGPEPVGPAESEVSLEDVTRLPLILPHGNQWVRPMLEAAATRLGLNLNIVLEIDSTPAVMELVAQGIGYSIMPNSLRKISRLPPMAWQKISGTNLDVVLSLISPVRVLPSALVTEAAQLVRDTLTEVLGAD
ncbi:LysR family transcriptional regulator [Caldimonas thermodepolymerans]|uniref:LysR family transcriptional regulator n=1 Tax=Caldimonas thermodepolymerans TaxID=215580 RepID=A0AA46DBI1_9BURK|nr:LysR family transcriptional regulator [Caldimonas thermodepolymerans]TCP03231.1 LysR family transcriptional regulator [Caldimonas thermodepolymerans]UZG47926.1 LysR family transcriptional regulator [Caldimonas thermodepolymerans]